jgi:hypothetical protein
LKVNSILWRGSFFCQVNFFAVSGTGFIHEKGLNEKNTCAFYAEDNQSKVNRKPGIEMFDGQKNKVPLFKLTSQAKTGD